MAGAILSSILKMTTEKLSAVLVGASPTSESKPRQLLFDGRPRGGEEEDDQLAELKGTMLWIQEVLEDADDKDIPSHSEKLQLRELQYLAYDAEDVVDEYEYYRLQSELEPRELMGMSIVGHKRKSEEHKVGSSLITNNPDLYGLVHRIKKIKETFSEITKEWRTLDLPEKAAKRRRVRDPWRPPTTSSFYQSSVFGRETEKHKLIDILLSDDGDRSPEAGDGTVSVLPIVGLGGIGKTTLAQLVYNDPEVCRNFDLRGWVCVSEEFDILSLLRKILVSFLERDVNYADLDSLRYALMVALQGKRFLLVLDNVWNDMQSHWEPVKEALLMAGVGKVLVTTRNYSVASVLQTRPPMELKELSFEECWELFKKVAFSGLDVSGAAELIETGKKIVEKCRGLPLAVKVLGGILRGETDEEAWNVVLESELWELEHEQDEIMPALKLSYNHMPAHLKWCFMYFSLLPKNFCFVKDEIVKLWMSQGLLQPNDLKTDMEDLGDDYVNDLLQRSILQQTESNDGLQMHDLIHDLARSITGRDDYSMTKLSNLSTVLKNVRHLSVAFPSKDQLTSDIQSCQNLKLLRTLMLVRYPERSCWFQATCKIPGDMFLRLKCIKTLDLSYSGIDELPESVGSLIQLRYLCIKHTYIKILPESVCNLFNLQTLDLDMEFQKLPIGLGKLFKLRHLMLPHPDVCLPKGMGLLTNLQTLWHFNAGKDVWHSGIDELKNLANLRGSLQINWLNNACNKIQVSHAEGYLKNKKGLVSLELNWPAIAMRKCLHRDDTDTMNEHKISRQKHTVDEQLAEQLLESLQPHTNIKKLKVYRYPGLGFPRWLSDPSFSNLESVYLSTCSNPSFLPPLGQLPSLRVLSIKGIKHVQYIDREIFGGSDATMAFPSLEELNFYNMPQWTDWRGLKEGCFPRLCRLTVDRCPQLKKLPLCLLSSIKELDINFDNGFPIIEAFPKPNSLSSITMRGDWNPEMFCSSNMAMLQVLGLSDSFQKSLALPAHNLLSLKKIKASKCSELTSLVGLCSLTSLESLHVSYCSQIMFDQLPPSLQVLNIASCNAQIEEWCQKQPLKLKMQVTLNESLPWLWA